MNAPTTGRLTTADLLDAPIPDVAAALNTRRMAKRREAVLAERGLMLSPLMLLAACGGGGGGGTGNGGNPPPPSSATITAQPDVVAATAGTTTPVIGNVLANDTTSSGTLAVSAVAIQNGAAGTVGTPMQGTLGTLTINANGQFSFTVADNAAVKALGAGQTGTNIFTYTPSAGSTNGTAQTVTVTVTGVNDAPTAVDDSGSVTKGATAAITGNVRTNDTDPDANAVLKVSAVNGNAASVGQDVTGTYGTIHINEDGSYTYTLNNADPDTVALAAGQTATESFTYTIRDDQGATSNATIAITVSGGGAGGGGQGPTSIDLAALGSGGATLSAPGGLTGAQFGFSIASIQPGGTADVTGDGKADLVVSAPFGAGGTGAGRVFVFSGDSLTGTPARTLIGTSNGDRFGYDVSVGNIGGTAQADVLVGAPGFIDGVPNAGRLFAFFGGGTASSATPGPNGTNGFYFTANGSGSGTAAYPAADSSTNLTTNLGAHVAILADINGDGTNDFFVSVPGFEGPGGVQDVGEAFVGYTKSYPSTATLGVQGIGTVAETPGFRIESPSTADYQSFTAAASGDVLGSSSADLVLGNSRSGEVFVLSGALLPSNGRVDYGALDGTNGVRLTLNAQSGFGESVAVGDINGDGRADVIVGAPGANKVYVLLGAANYAGGTIDVANPGGAQIIEISGTGGFGHSVAYVGDFNKDGIGDFAVGAPTDGTNGSAYILLGSSNASASTLNLTTGNVIKLTGGASGTGAEVAGPGDLNGDGFADVAIGAVSGTNTNGAVYVVYGRGAQASSAVAQEAVALDNGSNDIFGDDHGSHSVTVDPVVQHHDLQPNDVLI